MPVVQFCNVCYWTHALWICLRFLKRGVRLGQVLLQQRCKPHEEEEELVRTAKSRASDTWLCHISHPLLLRGKHVGPRCDCTCSDLNSNFPGTICTILSLAQPQGMRDSSACTIRVRKDFHAAEVTPREAGLQVARNSEQKWAPSLVISHCKHLWLGILVQSFLSPPLRECTG